MSEKIEVPFSNGYYYPPAPRPQIAEILKLKRSGSVLITSHTANNPIEQLQEHGVKVLLKSDELKLRYEGWKILSYEEERGTSKNALGVAFESARLIAQKP